MTTVLLKNYDLRDESMREIESKKAKVFDLFSLFNFFFKGSFEIFCFFLLNKTEIILIQK